ncbi:excalibur calcium-binding domain-containing protein [Allorhizocola rhizosphaerae]|uniref:excalibur calcium-binding domain-containing protein n=1 Tax=Allorhizocola rhizosphaerae TaxID=1872709 RepID=UPI0013C36CA5|nr:excalibur calcium-binding domain-containing protein [Allorhizocola rhizosphaerae]
MSHSMRRLASAALLTAAVSAASIPAMAFAAQDQPATVKTEANLRAEPNSTSTIRDVIAEGTAVDVVCWAQGEPTYGTDKYGSMWLYLSRGGWAHSVLITPVDVPPCGADIRNLFDNCDEARSAGAAPVHAVEPGYGLHLDRDRDGVGCEQEE